MVPHDVDECVGNAGVNRWVGPLGSGLIEGSSHRHTRLGSARPAAGAGCSWHRTTAPDSSPPALPQVVLDERAMLVQCTDRLFRKRSAGGRDAPADEVGLHPTQRSSGRAGQARGQDRGDVVGVKEAAPATT